MRTYYPTTVWLMFTLVGISISSLASVLTSIAIDELSLAVVADGGQFAVYTFGMVFSTLYILNRPGELRLPFSELFTLATILVLLSSTALVVLTTLVAFQAPSESFEISPEIFRWPSIGLFSFSVVVGAIAFRLDEKRASIDPLAVRVENEEAFREGVREALAAEASASADTTSTEIGGN